MFTPLIYMILSFVPAGIITLIVEAWHRFHYSGRRTPVSDKMLRAPGESCRQKMEELKIKVLEISILLVVCPSTFLIGWLSSNGTASVNHLPINGWLIPFIIFAAAGVVSTIWLISFVRQWCDSKLGFSGERAVGEHLNQLMAEGCRVCHDFPLTENWNIDHIVIAPSGVYAIETKAKRKGSASAALQAHEVIYDGKTLEFPNYRDSRFLVQARNQADRLSKFLTTALKSQQPVRPVVTLPGWYVINRGRGDVLVANPKLLEREILTHDAPILSPERIRDIAKVLEHKCRDVEF